MQPTLHTELSQAIQTLSSLNIQSDTLGTKATAIRTGLKFKDWSFLNLQLTALGFRVQSPIPGQWTWALGDQVCEQVFYSKKETLENAGQYFVRLCKNLSKGSFFV